jgi:gluconolactonase
MRSRHLRLPASLPLLALVGLLSAFGCTNDSSGTSSGTSGNAGSSAGGSAGSPGAGGGSSGTGAGMSSGGNNLAGSSTNSSGSAQGGASVSGGTAGQAGATVNGGAGGTSPMTKLGPTGNTCPAGPFDAPLAGNMKATLVKGDLGGELEGPVWLESQKALLFTQAGGGNANGKINKYTPADGKLTTFVSNVGVGGLAIDQEGKLLAASYDKRSITRFDPVTAQRSDVPGGSMYDGRAFNEVNDIVMRSDGNIYLSDPQYDSVPPGTFPMAFYRLSPPPESKVTLVLAADGSNGVALSPDGAYLYLGTTESDGGPVRRLALNPDGSPKGEPVEWKEDSSDGMAMDCAGNLYISADNQIKVLSANDEVLGTITDLGDGYVTNSAFGDEDHKTLYITTNGSLYKAQLQVPGFPN